MRKTTTFKITDDIKDLVSSDLPVIALNLMGLSLVRKNMIRPESTIFWCDGILGKVACHLNSIRIRRMPGRNLLINLISTLDQTSRFDRIILLGFKSKNLKVLNDMSKLPIECVDLPYLNIQQINHLTFPDVNFRNSLVIICISSPKQEILAQRLFNHSETKVFCLGAACNMIEGNERVAPKILTDIGFEWLFRLLIDPKTKVKRLFSILSDGLICLTLIRLECWSRRRKTKS